MFFITKDGIKDWKEGDAWYKPVSVEGYEASTTSTSPKVIFGISIGLAVFALLCIIAYLAYRYYRNRSKNVRVQ